MKHSENLDKFSKALAQVQSELEPLKKTAENPFLKTKYIPLDDIINMVRPILYRNGFSVIQLPIGEPGEGSVGLTTMLIHESDQWVEESFYMPIEKEKGKSLAQVAGSIISYARRYALGAMVGIITDEDTDGHQAPRKQVARPSVSPRAPTNGQGQESGPTDAEKQAYWNSLTPEEKGVYRSLGNLIPAIIEKSQRYENDIAARGAVKKFFPRLEDTGWPGSNTWDDARLRVTIYRKVTAYASLRNAGMDAGRAMDGAEAQAKNKQS